MAELDAEMLERVQTWCAEAGRRTTPSEIRSALEPLGWDELLKVRALLADPPPALPLGPFALADLARGAPADVAAEREREGRYRPEAPPPAEREPLPEPGAAPPASRPGRPRKGQRRPAMPVVHRKREQAAPEAQPTERVLLLEELRQPSGRRVLERLLRKQGARRSFLLAGLAAWRRADGAAPADEDLDALLDHHGLARAFAHRERDELLHALRAARGEQAAAATRVGMAPEAYRAALERLGAGTEAERLRAERRTELRARATLAERCRMLLEEQDRLADLGLLAEVEEDLKARFPEHLRALRAGEPGAALRDSFARSLGLPAEAAATLAARLGLDLAPGGGASSAGPAERPRSRGVHAPSHGGSRPPRRGAPREGGAGAPRRGGPRPGGAPRPGGMSRPGGAPRPGGMSRPGGAPRPGGMSRPGGAPRPGGMSRPGGAPRPGGMSRPGGAPRPGGMSRPGGAPRPGGMSRPGGAPRPGGMSRPGGAPRPGGMSRPAGSRPARPGSGAGARQGPPRRPGPRPRSAAPRTGRPSGPPRGSRPGARRPPR